MTEEFLTALGRNNPGAVIPGRIVTNVPRVTAFEVRDPIPVFILMESDDSAFHQLGHLKLQERPIERPWKQRPQPQRFCLPGEVRQHNLHIPAEFPQNLPARSARRRQRLRIRHNRNSPELPRSFRNRLEHRHSLRAHRESVSRVLHIAARVNAAALILHCSSDFKTRKRRVRIVPRPNRRLHQRIAHSATSFGTIRRSNSVSVPFIRSPVASTSA